MTSSLRVRLFVVLLGATGAIWLAAVVWIYTSSRHQVEHVLDTRLQEAARMVVSLVEGAEGAPLENTRKSFDPARLGSYERQLSCQVWSLDGRMIARSSGAPNRSLTDDRAGFSDRQIEGETWRVFAVEDEVKGVRVLVGDRLGLRERLVTDLIKGLLWPALLIAPLLGLMIWISISRGLRPLRVIANDLVRRDAADMSPVNVMRIPSEVRPVVNAINALFNRVELARKHEREVTAFAAHELRTPLAGLKAQAQVALAAEDRHVVQGALRQIVIAVDRSARLVRQLLTIARLDAHSDRDTYEVVALGPLIGDVVEATGGAPDVAVTIDGRLHDLKWTGNRECLELAIRNVHENAVQHLQNGGLVKWAVGTSSDQIIIEDTGPGIPDDELPKVGTRFFRGRFKSPNGSGLGLAIARLALERTGAELSLRNRTDGPGLRVEIVREFRPA